MESVKDSIHSGRVALGRTSYFLDVRQAVNGRFYLLLTESRRVSAGGFDQSRMFLFEEGAVPFREALDEALAAMRKAVDARGETSSPGENPGRRGSRWTPEDDEILRREFLGAAALEDLAGRLDRSRKAVELRLEKLGLLTPAESAQPSR